MAEHHIHVTWKRNEAAFLDKRYPRQHTWIINNTTEIPAAASPLVVPPAYTDASAIDPEEAFTASLASCHMLWFLSLAADQGYCIDAYTDQARGTLSKDKDDRLAITRVTLRPYVVFSGEKRPSADDIHSLHHAAHAECFIANSVKTEVVCEPQLNVVET